MTNILDSGVKLVRNVSRFNVGSSSLDELANLLIVQRYKATESGRPSQVIFLVDQYFKSDASLVDRIGFQFGDELQFIQTNTFILAWMPTFIVLRRCLEAIAMQ